MRSRRWMLLFSAMLILCAFTSACAMAGSYENPNQENNRILKTAKTPQPKGSGSTLPSDIKIPDGDSGADDKDGSGVLISFAGDCTLGTDETFPYNTSFPFRLAENNNDYGYFFKDVRPILSKDDLTLVNLEGTLTTATKKAEKKYRFKGDPSYVNILKAGSIEMVNLANNHTYDYLEQGFKDTIQTLKDNGIKYSGMGYTAYHTKKGITIASIGYQGWDTSSKKTMAEDIRKARKKAQVVIVSFHWGTEYTFYPNGTQTELARYAIDNGADVVIGHHPHVIQGIEYYKNRFILYSMGNFCFGGNDTPADYDTFIFQNRFVFKGKNLIKSEGYVIPCSLSSRKGINDYQPTVLKDQEKQRVVQRLYTLSKDLKYGIGTKK